MPKNQKGFFSPLIIIGIILIILGIIGFLFSQYKAPMVDTNPHPFPLISYCSLQNGCPSDKCTTVMRFSGIDSSSGEMMTNGYDCTYKDYEKKDNYKQITYDKAKECLQKFMNNNTEYPVLSEMEIVTGNESRENMQCLNSEIASKNGDLYCYSSEIAPKTGSKFSYKENLYIGAQSCHIYDNYLPPVFRTSKEVLSAPLIGIDKALACAKAYVNEVKKKFPEKDKLSESTLFISFGTGPDMSGVSSDEHIAEFSKGEDYLFYNIRDNIPLNEINLYIGANTCRVYDNYESSDDYTKLN